VSDAATATGSIATAADVMAVMAVLPHRFPMLLVDRVEDIVLGTSCRGIKAVTINEPFFAGHFPGRPIMPGVLIVEALAQTAGVLAIRTLGDAGLGKLVYFMSIDNAKFRAPVEPGCLLDLKVDYVQNRGRVSKFAGRAEIAGKLVAEASFTAMIAEPPEALYPSPPTTARSPRAAHRHAAQMIAAPSQTCQRTGSAKTSQPNSAAQGRALNSSTASACASTCA